MNPLAFMAILFLVALIPQFLIRALPALESARIRTAWSTRASYVQALEDAKRLPWRFAAARRSTGRVA
ncbi:MAG: hypothetical protein KAY24_14545 [Candidatus Eisenbacteria sp.]|nr:hypothetical protein [Candidatus Eisenbacteria bacterium]